jgi:hypothetical protein
VLFGKVKFSDISVPIRYPYDSQKTNRILTPENQRTTSKVGADMQQPVVRKQARPGWVAIDFAELWRYRELLVFYAIRDIFRWMEKSFADIV